MRQILINVEPYEKRVAIISRDTLEEFYIERSDEPRLAGNIYKGIIESVMPGIGGAFVNIGTGKNGFLYIRDLEGRAFQTLLGEEIIPVGTVRRGQVEGDRCFSVNHSHKSTCPLRDTKHLSPHEAGPKKGQELLVQIVKEPLGTKGPLLTTDISLPGKYIVLMPFHDTVGISKRITDRLERAELKEHLEKLDLPKGMGCIARTESVGVGPRQLRLELRYLINLWFRIRQRGESQKAPALIYEEYDLPLRIIRDYIYEDVEKLLIDSKEEYRKVLRFANSIQPKLRRKIFYYRGKTPLYERYGIEDRIHEIFKRTIFLKSGSSIVIEQTEGLVAIDVNSGKFKGKEDPEETSFRTNMEAASEIARQIMLRDMGGIIVIDFIDMGEKDHRTRVYETLEDAFKRDKAKLNILTISPLGLVEMTRQRVRRSLEGVSLKKCPYCNGLGRVKTPATVTIETLRKLEFLLNRKMAREIFVTLHPDVGAYLEDSFKHVIETLERKFRKKIIIKTDSKLHVEDVYFE